MDWFYWGEQQRQTGCGRATEAIGLAAGGQRGSRATSQPAEVCPLHRSTASPPTGGSGLGQARRPRLDCTDCCSVPPRFCLKPSWLHRRSKRWVAESLCSREREEFHLKGRLQSPLSQLDHPKSTFQSPRKTGNLGKYLR